LMDVVIKAHGDKVQMIDSSVVRVHRKRCSVPTFRVARSSVSLRCLFHR